ncbi:hypothetical protein CQ10_33270 [Bradyrhizobium valentinum]|nr:hypothetical protein CQ10_33270 [Bradyrhizobium valentinum]
MIDREETGLAMDNLARKINQDVYSRTIGGAINMFSTICTMNPTIGGMAIRRACARTTVFMGPAGWGQPGLLVRNL